MDKKYPHIFDEREYADKIYDLKIRAYGLDYFLVERSICLLSHEWMHTLDSIKKIDRQNVKNTLYLINELYSLFIEYNGYLIYLNSDEGHQRQDISHHTQNRIHHMDIMEYMMCVTTILSSIKKIARNVSNNHEKIMNIVGDTTIYMDKFYILATAVFEAVIGIIRELAISMSQITYQGTL